MTRPSTYTRMSHDQYGFLKSAHEFLIHEISMPALFSIFVLIVSAGVMTILGQPLIGFAMIVGIPVLFLLCTYPKSIVYALIGYSFVSQFLANDIGVGGIANYVCDGLLLLALFFALTKRESSLKLSSIRVLERGWFIFWAVATLSAITHGVSLGLYLWACRSTFRLFGTLYCCAKLLHRSDVDRLIKFTFGFFFVNAVVCTYQHFVLGIGPDNTNGFFGTASGGNAMMNVLLCAVCAFSLFGFLEDEYSGLILLLVVGCSCYLAAIAELKFFYFELAGVVILAVLFQRFSAKSVLSVIVIALAIVIGIRILGMFNPYFADFFSLDRILDYSGRGGYSTPYNLNRMTAVHSLDQRFMTTWGDKLFGLGFGAGQYSQFFASPLYAAYGSLLNWSWFTDASVFLETGYVGLVFYILPFIMIALFSLRSIRSGEQSGMMQKREDGIWVKQSCASVSLLCLLLIVYNCTLTTDPGCFFIGYILSFPYILQEDSE